MSEKNTIINYIKWRGDLSFTRDEANEVDALLFAVIAYLTPEICGTFDGHAIDDAPDLAAVSASFGEYSEGKERMTLVDLGQITDVLHLAAAQERFQKVKLLDYTCLNDEKMTMQFAAMTFLLPDDRLFIAYRGTDDSLVGWKEDLNMSYAPFVAAQEQALAYLTRIAEQIPAKSIYITGHSKGGNLAVYAAVKASAEIKERLLGVYNNDGPGFHREFLETEDYRSISKRLHTFIPESSIVGMLLEHEESYRVIASHAKAFLQHAPLSWEVMGKHFVYLEERSEFGRHTDAVISNWLKTCTDEEKEEFIDVLFDILASGRAKTLSEITEGEFFHHWRQMLKTYTGMDKERRELLNDLLKRLMSEMKNEALSDNKILRKIEETF